MKQHQKGEVMLVVMVVMLVVVWLGSGHMGMMGHGEHAEKLAGAAQQHTETQMLPAPTESTKHQHLTLTVPGGKHD